MKQGLGGQTSAQKTGWLLMNNSNAFQCDVAALPPNVFQEGL
jgi:hypothetical protein